MKIHMTPFLFFYFYLFLGSISFASSCKKPTEEDIKSCNEHTIANELLACTRLLNYRSIVAQLITTTNDANNYLISNFNILKKDIRILLSKDIDQSFEIINYFEFACSGWLLSGEEMITEAQIQEAQNVLSDYQNKFKSYLVSDNLKSKVDQR